MLIIGCSKENETKPDSVIYAPSNLSTIIFNNSQINLSWTDNSTNETGFRIERKIGTNNYQAIKNTDANITNYNDQGLQLNTEYTYRVVAYNSVGASSPVYSSIVTITSQSVVPTIRTSIASNITTNSADLGGDIISDGGSPITSYGVVWSTSPSPTIALPTKVNFISVKSPFTYYNKSLNDVTTYYYRAYATNLKGTNYGNEVSFTTMPKSTVYTVGESSQLVAALWVGGTKSDFKDNLVEGSRPNSVYVSGTDVYVVGGGFTTVTQNSNYYFWKNGIPKRLYANGKMDNDLNSIVVSNTDVYIGGGSDSKNSQGSSITVPTIWKNEIATILSNNEGTVNSVSIVGSDVYAAGWVAPKEFQSLVPTIWKNGAPIYLSDQQGSVLSIFVNGSDVYAVGYIRINQIEKAVLWKNGNLTTLYNNAVAKSIFISNSNVYIVINSNSSAPTRESILYKNGVFTPLNITMTGNVFVSGMDVYISGISSNGFPAVSKNGTVSELSTSAKGSANYLFVKP